MYSAVFFKETGGARPCCDFIKIKGKEPVTRGKRRGKKRGKERSRNPENYTFCNQASIAEIRFC
jgi:hypothetical protein